MLAAFLTTILFSVSAVSATRTARIMGGTEANFWRLVLATLLLALYAHTYGQGLTGGAFHLFFLSGCIGFGLGDVALYQALPRLGSRLTILLVHCLAAPFAAATEWLWMGTSLSGTEMIAGATILVGVGIAIAPGGHLHLNKRTLVPGVLFGVLASYGQGFGAVLSRKAYAVAALGGGQLDGITTAYQRILGGLLISGLFLLAIKHGSLWSSRPKVNPSVSQTDSNALTKWSLVWGWVIINAVSGPALGVSFYQWALESRPTGLVLPIVAITPLVVVPFARYMEGERPTKRSLLGGLVAVIGAILLTVASR